MTRLFGHGGMAARRRSLLSAFSLGLGGLAIGCGLVWPQAAGLAAPAPEPSNADGAAGKVAAGVALVAGADTVPAFPLAVEPGMRYLLDAAGEPFLLHGDTAWSLIAQLTREDVVLYLDDRRARGFNAILVNLIEHAFATNAPANAYGEPPFLKPGDYSTPNEAYFRHADWVLRQAAERDFLVLLTPSYLGYRGGSSGWYERMVANGPDRLREYGEFLGRRYRDFTNILWVQGGDYDPPRKDLVRAIAEGIREFDPRALHTAHGAPGTALDYWGGEPWLQVNNVYTYGPVHAPALQQYARPERMPFFLIESAYENAHPVSERDLRMQAYQAVLSGATGQIFGNGPIWHFDGPGLGEIKPMTWQEALGSRGAQSMTHLCNLLAAVPWWLLEPDIDNSLLTDGLGPKDDRAVAGRSGDRSFAILYLPSNRDINVDLEQLAGPQVIAQWYDPADGQLSAVSGSPFRATGSRRFRPESDTNSSGFEDWILILESWSTKSTKIQAGATP